MFVLVLKPSFGTWMNLTPLFATTLIVGTQILCAGLNQSPDGQVRFTDMYAGQCQRIFVLGLLAGIIGEAILGSAGLGGMGTSLTSEAEMALSPTYLMIAAGLGAAASLAGEWIDARFLRRTLHT